MDEHKYVHGYSSRENERLLDQADVLTELLHHDTRYSAGCSVLEAGCGVGAQTVVLAANNPETRFTSIDISQASLNAAQSKASGAGCKNVVFRKADIFNLPFPDESFDHLFLCFVLEHLNNPLDALRRLGTKLRPGGTITVIEGDHESTLFYPPSRDAWRTIQCLIDLQKAAGGNALIGRELFPLLQSARFRNVAVSPRMVYADASRPKVVEGFTKNTYIAMVKGVQEQALSAGLIKKEIWDNGIRDLYKAAGPEGTFCYTFFKAVACK